MMAKKRRRRRVDGAKPAPAAGTTPPKTAAAASPVPKQETKDADEEEEGDGGMVLPPMPSELGRDAVMAAQVRVCEYRPVVLLLCCFWLQRWAEITTKHALPLPPPGDDGWV